MGRGVDGIMLAHHQRGLWCRRLDHLPLDWQMGSDTVFLTHFNLRYNNILLLHYSDVTKVISVHEKVKVWHHTQCVRLKSPGKGSALELKEHNFFKYVRSHLSSKDSISAFLFLRNRQQTKMLTVDSQGAVL